MIALPLPWLLARVREAALSGPRGIIGVEASRQTVIGYAVRITYYEVP